MIASVTPVHDAPFTGKGAWKAADFSSPEDWTYRFPPVVLAELNSALRRVKAAGLRIPEITRAEFDLPSFTHDGAKLREEVESGRGFVLIRGLPPDRYMPEEAAILYWGLGLHIGLPIPQNAKQEYLFSVRDEGYNFERDYGAAGVRISRTASAIDFHTDSSATYAGYTPDIVALLALQVARQGGESAFVSAQAVHNVLLAERPDCLRRLYQPFYFDRRAELRAGESPTIFAPVFAHGDALSIRYFRFNLMRGHQTAGVPLTSQDLEAIDYLEAVFHRPELAVRLEMQRGDMQFVNNRFVLHSRTAFDDDAESGLRRDFLRLWMRYRGV